MIFSLTFLNYTFKYTFLNSCKFHILFNVICLVSGLVDHANMSRYTIVQYPQEVRYSKVP